MKLSSTFADSARTARFVAHKLYGSMSLETVQALTNRVKNFLENPLPRCNFIIEHSGR